MASRWWDPGDLGVCGEFSSREGFGLAGWKVVLILRWFGLKRDKGIRERLRNHRIIRDLLAILIFIKTVSPSREGNISGDCNLQILAFLWRSEESITDWFQLKFQEYSFGFLVVKYRRRFCFVNPFLEW